MQLPISLGPYPSVPQPMDTATRIILTNQIRKATPGGVLSILANGGSPVVTWDDSSGVMTVNFGMTLTGFGGGTGVVSVGAVDSGGAGFRLLRVPN